MLGEKALKELLLQICQEDKIPEGTNIYQLALEMMEYIGSTDPVLRDDLILSVLWYFIDDQLLTSDQLKELLEICLSEQHLFFRLGEEEDDSVFNRSFTILIIRRIIYYHNTFGGSLLTEEEAIGVFNEVIKYIRRERDIRGYVAEKGWAHSTAHSGDALKALALCNHMRKEHLSEMLQVIKEKICISHYAYVNEESERLTSAVVNIIERNILNEDEVIGWINSFEEVTKPTDIVEKHYYCGNTNGLLRSLYFRLKFRNPQIRIINELEKTIHKINSFNSINIG